MTWLWISLGLFSVLVVLMFLCMCKVASDSDAWGEREAQRMMERKGSSQEAGGSFHEEVRNDVTSS